MDDSLEVAPQQLNRTNDPLRTSKVMTNYSTPVTSSSKATIDAPSNSPSFGRSKTLDVVSTHSDVSGTHNTNKSHLPLDSLQIPVPATPPFSRSRSMPGPTQLGSLKHPHRVFHPSTAENASYADTLSNDQTEYSEISLEMADSVQCMIQTILQVSPSQLLDPAREQYSACSLSVPTPSMSAILTSMRHLNYLAKNFDSFCGASDDANSSNGSDPPCLGPTSAEPTDFDVGEILQSTADNLGGTAAQAGVDLVLFHADVGLKHVWVHGDEGGLSFALSHVLRQILLCCIPGDSIELGLHLKPAQAKPGEQSTSPTLLRGKVSFFHRYLGSAKSPSALHSNESRCEPRLNSLILRRILKQTGATLSSLPPPKGVGSEGRTYALSFRVEKASPPPPNPLPQELGSTEPTVDELTAFAETLRGKKVALYASSDGSFARHLSSYLTAWGLDVNHISLGDQEVSSGSSSADGGPQSPLPPHAEPGSKSERKHVSSPGVPLALIDDDVEVLKECLQTFRFEEKAPLPPKKTRPSLAAHHRPKSSPQITRAMGSSLPSTLTIVHFTSLANYKIVKDLIDSTCSPYLQNNALLPPVMVLIKPAGPRRFLTALYTALKRPVVDPFFLPIATSPGTPLTTRNSFIGSASSQNESSISTPRASPGTHRPTSSRTSSDRSIKPGSGSHPETPAAVPPPSPLANSETVEYFPEKTPGVKHLGATASAGMMLQSPDGQHSIFFQPRSKTPKPPPAPVVMERENNVQSFSRSNTSPSNRRTSPPPPRSFSSFVEATVSSPAETFPQSESPVISTPLLSQSITPAILDIPASSSPPQGDEEAAKNTSSPPRSPPMKERRPMPRKPSGNDPKKNSSQNGESNIVPPINVLIVEDNPINRAILSTFMKKRKIKYDVAVNGKEAVDKWSTGAFHLVLMDIQMPVMDGIEATKQIRYLEKANSAAGFPLGTPPAEKTPPIPTPTRLDSKDSSSPFGDRLSPRTPRSYRSSVIIVALTASNSQTDRDNALAAGCNDFLTKPVSLIWLNSKIIEWGSIKALQMWADLRPPNSEAKINATQNAAKVAEKLHIGKPTSRGAGSVSRQEPVRSPSQASEGDKSASSAITVNVSGPSSTPPSRSSTGLGEREATTAQDSSGSEVTAVQQPSSILPEPSSKHKWKQDVANDVEEALGSYYEEDSDDDEATSVSSSTHQLDRGEPTSRGQVTQRTMEPSAEPVDEESVGDPSGTENTPCEADPMKQDGGGTQQ